MPTWWKNLDPRTKVVAPFFALSIVACVLLFAFAASVAQTETAQGRWLMIGAASYLALTLALAVFGFSYIGKLERLGMTDSLTGLPNRRALHKFIQTKAGDEDEIAIALVDLDGFKLINDQHGHGIGDSLIKKCAVILTACCGNEARCFRLGGDEFAIAMIGPLAGTILEGISRKFIDTLKRPVQLDERRLAIGASIGLSRTRPGRNENSSELLRQADVAMYASKRGGKMRCTWFSDHFDRDLEDFSRLDTEMRAALANGEFRVHYQPLVSSESGTVVAVESLLRWERPDGKRIGPDVFVPIAEETGLINPIGLWVLRQACMDALGWNGIMLSVNISAAQLRDPEFPIQLGHILEETGFPAERLELEITETCLVLDQVVAKRSLDVIRSFGIRVALDDFGTGYASIGFLRQFMFDKLKLDRSLVVSAEGDSGSRAMMVSSISVARALDMKITAEGVETEEQATLVRVAGCDQIQGWLYFRPLPADQIPQHLSIEGDTQSRNEEMVR